MFMIKKDMKRVLKFKENELRTDIEIIWSKKRWVGYMKPNETAKR